MEKIFAKAMAQLLSRASILMQVGVEHHIYTNMHPYIGHFTFRLGEIEINFNNEHPYDEAEVTAVLEQLDKRIFDWKKEAAAGIALIEAWGA